MYNGLTLLMEYSGSCYFSTAKILFQCLLILKNILF